VDKLWIRVGDLVFCVGKVLLSRVKERGAGDMAEFVHSYLRFIHSFSRSTLRFEQGFSLFSTYKKAGYYDYLYIYRSGYTTNLSLNWGAL